MTAVAARASDSAEDLAMMARAAVIGSLTIPGRPDQVSAARAFITKILGEAEPATDVAVLLASETVTNAVAFFTISLSIIASTGLRQPGSL